MRGATRLVCVVVAMVVGGVATQALASSRHVTGPQVATPISVHMGKAIPDCGPGGKSCGWPELLVTISFTSRVAIPNSRSWYEINMHFTPIGPCSHGHNDGLGARTIGDLRTRERAHVTLGISNCPGAVRGDVVYNGNTGAHTNQDVPGVGWIDGVLVGTFGFRMR